MNLEQEIWNLKEQTVNVIVSAIETARLAGVENPEEITLATIKTAIDYQQFKTDNSLM
ncbi:MAG: hypothetical protein HQK57_02830 [Deltaproteobacteria bacterium]|nr:hypothetical protein [Deltaproteobacteria bacterium]